MSAWRRSLAGSALALATVLVTLGAAELVVRSNRERFGLSPGELWGLRGYVCHGVSRFEPTAYVGWVFDPEREGVNSSGFLGPELPRARTPGVPRIACLGGSTTAGNLYEGYEHSYPGALARVLEERLGRPVEVLNFGMPGWTSAETLVNWFLNAQDYRPDVVVIQHAINDVHPRLWPPFRSDYTHYTHPWTRARYSCAERFLVRWSDLFALWRLRTWRFELADHVAVPAGSLPTSADALRPETAEPFRRNLLTLCVHARSLGAEPVLVTMPWDPARVHGPLDELRVLGMREHNTIARELAAEQGWALLDLAGSEDPELRASFVDLVHHSNAGHEREAGLLADFLLERGLLGAP